MTTTKTKWTKGTVYSLDRREGWNEPIIGKANWDKVAHQGFVSGNLGVYQVTDDWRKGCWNLNHRDGLMIGSSATRKGAIEMADTILKVATAECIERMASGVMTDEDINSWSEAKAIVRQFYR